MRLPLRYRSGESSAWVNATTENISVSGVLFVTDHLEAPETPIEMDVRLPTEILGGGASRVICQGRIVRTVAATEGGKAAMAATIANYELVRGGNDATVLISWLVGYLIVMWQFLNFRR